MITIAQLLESVDLDFEPRFVTKDKSGTISIWADKPSKDFASNAWLEQTEFVVLHLIKLAEFENKDWTECIYEVPRKTTGKIEKLLEQKLTIGKTKYEYPTHAMMIDKINELVDAVNGLQTKVNKLAQNINFAQPEVKENATMSDMKCPFCNSEIEQLNDQQRSLFHCSNIVCCKGGHYIGNISMWRDLIRTRKALDIAVDALAEIDWCATDYARAQDALNKITALEQKDVK